MAGIRTERLALLLAPSDPDSLAAWMRRYVEALTVQHRSGKDVGTRRSKLAHFHHWAHERGIERPEQVTHAHMQGFPLDAFAQACLLEGVDQLGYLLARHPAIQRFEAARDAAGAA